MAKIDVTKVWAQNYRVMMAVMAEVAPALNELGLEVKELFLLQALDAHPHPAALAEALMMPKPTVTMYLKRLEAAGLVERSIDCTDLRRHKLTMTSSGKKLMARGNELLVKAFGQRLDRLTATQQHEFRALLDKLG